MAGQTLSFRNIPWARFLVEAALIVGSVYLAIVLEGNSSDRSRKDEAIAALTNLRAELELDREDGEEILSLQNGQAFSHQKIQAWLTDTPSIPADLFSSALVHTLTKNRTVFPRRASWTTMVAEGQLTVLGDPALIRSLANLYEHSNVRLEYNGDRYDDTTQDMLRGRMPYAWDLVESRFVTTEPAAIRTFGNQMLHVQRQNRNYAVLLSSWLEEVENVHAQVTSYLEQNNGER